jgi:hypothetical protein
MVAILEMINHFSNRHIPIFYRRFTMSNDILLNAIWNGDIETVKSEVEKGSDVNCVDYKTEGQPTALILALKAGHEEIAKYLISKGANVNGVDKNGNTCLFNLKMCKNGSNMAQLLIENGADVNIINVFGFTALKFCESDVATILKNAGAKIAEPHLNHDSSADQGGDFISKKGTNDHTITIKRTNIKDDMLNNKDFDAIDTFNEIASGGWEIKRAKDVHIVVEAQTACSDHLWLKMNDNPKRARAIIAKLNPIALKSLFDIMTNEAVKRLFREESDLTDRFFNWIFRSNEQERLGEVHNLIRDLINKPEADEAVSIIFTKLGPSGQALFKKIRDSKFVE